jgi:hypothetical protein
VSIDTSQSVSELSLPIAMDENLHLRAKKLPKKSKKSFPDLIAWERTATILYTPLYPQTVYAKLYEITLH